MIDYRKLWILLDERIKLKRQEIIVQRERINQFADEETLLDLIHTDEIWQEVLSLMNALEREQDSKQ